MSSNLTICVGIMCEISFRNPSFLLFVLRILFVHFLPFLIFSPPPLPPPSLLLLLPLLLFLLLLMLRLLLLVIITIITFIIITSSKANYLHGWEVIPGVMEPSTGFYEMHSMLPMYRRIPFEGIVMKKKSWNLFNTYKCRIICALSPPERLITTD